MKITAKRNVFDQSLQVVEQNNKQIKKFAFSVQMNFKNLQCSERSQRRNPLQRIKRSRLSISASRSRYLD